MTPEAMLQQLQQQQLQPQKPEPPPHILWELELIDGTAEKGQGVGQVSLQGPVILFPMEGGGHIGYNTVVVKKWRVTVMKLAVMEAR